PSRLVGSVWGGFFSRAGVCENPQGEGEVRPPNWDSIRMTLTPKCLRAQALRYRYLASKARRLASTMPGDPVAPRLIELAEKMEGDAIRHEEEACPLLAEQTEDAIGGSLPA